MIDVVTCAHPVPLSAQVHGVARFFPSNAYPGATLSNALRDVGMICASGRVGGEEVT